VKGVLWVVGIDMREGLWNRSWIQSPCFFRASKRTILLHLRLRLC
jgi:hypothetical protein